MRLTLPILVISFVVLAGTAATAPAQVTEGHGHKIVTPQEIKWGPAPPALPAGAQLAVLHGDPAKAGLFVMRLKMPKGYILPPHRHLPTEVVTVVSGTFRLGMGETADPSKAQGLPAGSLFVMEPGTAHFASTDEETVVQISTNGPWDITYVNPKDDPREKKAH